MFFVLFNSQKFQLDKDECEYILFVLDKKKKNAILDTSNEAGKFFNLYPQCSSFCGEFIN